MGGGFFIRDPGRQGGLARFRAPGFARLSRRRGFTSRRQNQSGLPTADQLQVNLCQNFGVEQCAVQCPGRVVDPEPAAKRIERRRGAREFLARDGQGIQRAFPRDLRKVQPAKLGVQELHVKACVVDHQLGIHPDEIEELLAHLAKERLVFQRHFTGLGRARAGL